MNSRIKRGLGTGTERIYLVWIRIMRRIILDKVLSEIK